MTDARAVAMTAARRSGMTLPAITTHFGKDHTTVMYAQNKVAQDPRLNAMCTRIVDQLQEHYEMPSARGYDADDGAPNRRSETMQLTALDQASNDAARPQEDDSQRLAVSSHLLAQATGG